MLGKHSQERRGKEGEEHKRKKQADSCSHQSPPSYKLLPNKLSPNDKMILSAQPRHSPHSHQLLPHPHDDYLMVQINQKSEDRINKLKTEIEVLKKQVKDLRETSQLKDMQFRQLKEQMHMLKMARMQSSEHGSIEARRSELGKIVSLGKCPHKKRKSLVPEQELAIRSDKIIVGLSYDSNKQTIMARATSHQHRPELQNAQSILPSRSNIESLNIATEHETEDKTESACKSPEHRCSLKRNERKSGKLVEHELKHRKSIKQAYPKKLRDEKIDGKQSKKSIRLEPEVLKRSPKKQKNYMVEKTKELLVKNGQFSQNNKIQIPTQQTSPPKYNEYHSSSLPKSVISPDLSINSPSKVEKTIFIEEPEDSILIEQPSTTANPSSSEPTCSTASPNISSSQPKIILSEVNKALKSVDDLEKNQQPNSQNDQQVK